MTIEAVRSTMKSILENATKDEVMELFALWNEVSDTGASNLTVAQTIEIERRRAEMTFENKRTSDWESMHQRIRNTRDNAI